MSLRPTGDAHRAVQRELAATVAIRLKAWDDAARHLAALVDIEPTREVHKRRLEALQRRLREQG